MLPPKSADGRASPPVHVAPISAPDEDGNLLESRLKAGDDTAVADLYRQYSRSMFLTAHHILGNREDAAEAVQQAFIQAWLARQRLDSRKHNLHSWLTTISRRSAIDLYRRERRNRMNVPLSECLRVVSHGVSAAVGRLPR